MWLRRTPTVYRRSSLIISSTRSSGLTLTPVKLLTRVNCWRLIRTVSFHPSRWTLAMKICSRTVSIRPRLSVLTFTRWTLPRVMLVEAVLLLIPSLFSLVGLPSTRRRRARPVSRWSLVFRRSITPLPMRWSRRRAVTFRRRLRNSNFRIRSRCRKVTPLNWTRPLVK